MHRLIRVGWVSIPYLQDMSDAVANVLRPLGIKVAHRAKAWKWSLGSGLKDKIVPEKKKGVVYCVPCHDCNAIYVGDTLRNLKARLKEHRRHVRGSDVQSSAVAEHAQAKAHQINWDGTEVLDTQQTWDKRKYKEALPIAQKGRQHLMMDKYTGWRIHRLWGEFL